MKLPRDLTLGYYYPGTSAIHCLDPRVKLGGLLAGAVTILALGNLWGLALAAVATFGIICLANLPLGMVLRGLRPFIGLFLLTAGIQLLCTDGRALVPEVLGPVSITREGVYQAVRICGQLCLIVLLSSILTLTTSPLELLRALEKLGRPLARLRVPVADLCLAMLLCIRFLPILNQEAQRILEAQKARGIDIQDGTLRQRFEKLHSIFVPLFYNALWRAEELATAMTVRGYGRAVEKETLKHMRLSTADRVGLVILGAGCTTLYYFFRG